MSKSAFAKKVKSLREIVIAADGVTPQWTDSMGYNEKIAVGLSDVLKDKRSIKLDFDVLFKTGAVGVTHSKDEKIWIFGWAENHNGTFKNAMNIMQVRISKKPWVIHDEYTNNDTLNISFDNPTGFVSNGAYFDTIIKLKSKRNLYLLRSRVVGCSTCCSEFAKVIELGRDSINFSYPAFAGDSLSGTKEGAELAIDSRCGSIRKFEFDAKEQTIVYEYETDDYTPVSRDYDDENDKPQVIRQVLYWNGEQFTDKRK
jgi:hypothetical protein